jgi:hypothetical protein
MLSIVKDVSIEEVVVSTVDPADDVTSLIVVDMNIYASPASDIVIIKIKIIAITSLTPRIRIDYRTRLSILLIS